MHVCASTYVYVYVSMYVYDMCVSAFSLCMQSSQSSVTLCIIFSILYISLQFSFLITPMFCGCINHCYDF